MNRFSQHLIELRDFVDNAAPDEQDEIAVYCHIVDILQISQAAFFTHLNTIRYIYVHLTKMIALDFLILMTDVEIDEIIDSFKEPQ